MFHLFLTLDNTQSPQKIFTNVIYLCQNILPKQSDKSLEIKCTHQLLDSAFVCAEGVNILGGSVGTTKKKEALVVAS